MVLPCMVVVTRMPFPFLEGRGKDIVDLDFSPVKDSVFSALRCDFEFRADFGLMHYLIRVQSGCVDHPAAFKIAAVGLNTDDAIAVYDESS